MMTFGAAQGTSHVLHMAGCRGWVFEMRGRRVLIQSSWSKEGGGGWKRETGVVLTWHMCQSFEMCVELSLLFTLFENSERAKEGQTLRSESGVTRESTGKLRSDRRHWAKTSQRFLNYFLPLSFWGIVFGRSIPMLGTITLTGKTTAVYGLLVWAVRHSVFSEF